MTQAMRRSSPGACVKSSLLPERPSVFSPRSNGSGRGVYFTPLGPLGLYFHAVDEQTRAQVNETVRADFDPCVDGSEVRFTAACWMVSARAKTQATGRSSPGACGKSPLHRKAWLCACYPDIENMSELEDAAKDAIDNPAPSRMHAWIGL